MVLGFGVYFDPACFVAFAVDCLWVTDCDWFWCLFS